MARSVRAGGARMVRRMVLLAWVAVVGSGCPHTWGKEGYVQRFLHENSLRKSTGEPLCSLNEAQWVELCGEETDHLGSCPQECPLPSEL